MLGISIYPEKATKKEVLDYLELAAKYNYKRVFANLLDPKYYSDEAIDAKQAKKTIHENYFEIIQKAKSLGMEFVVDVSNHVFKKLEIPYKDLKFFYDLGVTGIRLDAGPDASQVALMTHNQYDLAIEINMSMMPNYALSALEFSPNKKNLIGCHNFYPMEFSGLSLEFFIMTSTEFKNQNIRSAAFVSSNDAKFGPWPVMDGIPTLELHRDLPLETQVKHLYMMDIVDDIIIGNMFASEAELKAVSELPSYPVFKIKESKNLTEIEKKIMYDEDHVYRGDISDALIRSTWSRVTYRGQKVKPQNTSQYLEYGDVTIPNDNYEHYRAEVNIIKEDIPNNNKRRNVVAKIVEEEQFLIEFLSPWSRFGFKK